MLMLLLASIFEHVIITCVYFFIFFPAIPRKYSILKNAHGIEKRFIAYTQISFGIRFQPTGVGHLVD